MSEKELHIGLAVVIALVATGGIFYLTIFGLTEPEEIIRTIPRLEEYQELDSDRSSSSWDEKLTDISFSTTPDMSRYHYEDISPENQNTINSIIFNPNFSPSTKSRYPESLSNIPPETILIHSIDNPGQLRTEIWLNDHSQDILDLDHRTRWALYDGRKMAWLSSERGSRQNEYDVFVIPGQEYRKMHLFLAVYEPENRQTQRDLMQLIETSRIN